MYSAQKRGKLWETKEGEDRAEKQRQQVSTNGQWHVSAVARLNAGARTAEIFTRRTELIHFKSAWAERERERAQPIFYLLTELRQQHKQLNGQQHMNNVHVWLFILLIHSCPDGPFPSLCLQTEDERPLTKTRSNLFCLIQPHFNFLCTDLINTSFSISAGF